MKFMLECRILDERGNAVMVTGLPFELPVVSAAFNWTPAALRSLDTDTLLAELRRRTDPYHGEPWEDDK